jgi:hypothetical protein
MKFRQSVVSLTLLVAAIFAAATASAQSLPTASQQLQLSAFAGVSGTFLDIDGGKNAGFTAGVDLTFLRFRHFKPAIEARGTYPVDDGHLASEKNFLVGPKVEYPWHRLHPYGDFLIGRGEINYISTFIVGNDLQYISSNTAVYSPGGGLDYDLWHNIALKGDFQAQHWDTPVVPAGSVWAKSVTFAVVYNFDFNPHHHHKQ